MTITNMSEWKDIITENRRVIGQSRVIADASVIYMNTVNESWKIVRYNARLLLVGLLISAIAGFFTTLPITLEAVNPLAIGIPLSLSVVIAVFIGSIALKLHMDFIDNFPPSYLTDPYICKKYVSGSKAQMKLMKTLKVIYTDFIYYMSIVTLIFAIMVTATLYYPEYQIIKIISVPVSLIITAISSIYFMRCSIYIIKAHIEVLNFNHKSKGERNELALQ